jgi:hypothetical protein
MCTPDPLKCPFWNTFRRRRHEARGGLEGLGGSGSKEGNVGNVVM